MANPRSSNRRITRRDVLLAAGTAALAAASAPAAAPKRPNLLFIYTDDQRFDAIGCLGHPFLETPNLDRLRNEGVHFKNAFVVHSLCAPSRACILTGTYPHINGVLRNDGSEFDPKVTPSFPQLLQRAGYCTAYIGKWHMAGRSDPRPGFDYWLSFRGQGVYIDPDLNENGREFKSKGYMTDLLNEHAVRWLKTGRDRTRPFCLCLAHKAVHGPFTPAARHASLYPDAQMPKPASWDDTFAGKPAWQRAAVKGWAQDIVRSGNRARQTPASIPPEPWNPRAPGRLDYFRAISAVDDGIGQILQTLADSGELDNTVIIFGSDNGFFMGEHRRGDKRLAYEESIRIPLLMRYPALTKAGSTIEQMVLNIDIAPTLLDLAGAPIPAHMQGRSIRPLLEGRSVDWRKSFLYEYWLDLTPSIPTMVGVRTEDAKYIRYSNTSELDEMYDLRADPHEMKNLAQDPAHAQQKQAIAAELDRLMREMRYRPEIEPEDHKPRGVMLNFSFNDLAPDATRINDASGHANHGALSSDRPKLVAGRNGKALQFTGREAISIPNSPSLDPSSCPWIVEAVVKPEDDGVILAHGGASRGYLLAIENGCPIFAVRQVKRLMLVESRDKCLGQWAHLAGVIDGHRASLYINGKFIDSLPLMSPLRQTPTDHITIGRDLGSPVYDRLAQTGFRGLLERIRIHRQSPDEKLMLKLYEGD